MKKRSVVLLVSILILLLFVSAFSWGPAFLSLNQRIDTDHYLIEGWLDSWVIERFAAEFKEKPSEEVYVVGHNYPVKEWQDIRNVKPLVRDNGMLLLTNGCLVLDPAVLPKTVAGDTVNFSVRALGGVAEGIPTHFVLAVNGQKIASYFCSENMQTFRISTVLKEGLESLSIYYDNDMYTGREGRVLIVNSVGIGDEVIWLDTVNTARSGIPAVNYTGFSSAAEQIKAYLEDLGMDGRHIHPIPFNHVHSNQTLEAARTFRVWMQGKPVSSVNILSLSIHSRRSWITYNRILKGSVSTGVFFYPRGWKDPRKDNTWLKRKLHLGDELVSYTLNWVQLTLLARNEKD